MIRHVAPISSFDPASSTLTTDYAHLVAQLVVCDQLIIESPRLDEIPMMIEKFGHFGIRRLAESGRIRILSELITTGSLGDDEAALKGSRSATSQTDQFTLVFMTSHDREELARKGLEVIEGIDSISQANLTDVTAAIAPIIDYAPDESLRTVPAMLINDLSTNPALLHRAAHGRLEDHFGQGIDPHLVSIEVIDVLDPPADNPVITIRSNIGPYFSVPMQEAHRIVLEALLAIGALEYRLELTNRFDATTGFRDRHISLLDLQAQKFLERHSPQRSVPQYFRTINLSELPSIDPSSSVHDFDLEKFCDLLDSDLADDFRKWLISASDLTDEEIRAQLHSIRDRIALVFDGHFAKSFAMIAGVAVGLVVDPVSGALISASEKAIARIIGTPGAAAFVGKMYRASFESS